MYTLDSSFSLLELVENRWPWSEGGLDMRIFCSFLDSILHISCMCMGHGACLVESGGRRNSGCPIFPDLYMLVEPLSEREPLSYLICYFRFNVLSPAAAGCDLFIVPLLLFLFIYFRFITHLRFCWGLGVIFVVRALAFPPLHLASLLLLSVGFCLVVTSFLFSAWSLYFTI